MNCPNCGDELEKRIIFLRRETAMGFDRGYIPRGAKGSTINLSKNEVEGRKKMPLKFSYVCFSCESYKYENYYHDNKRKKINLNINKCPHCGSNDAILSDYNHLGKRRFDVVFKCSLTNSSSGCGEKFIGIAEPKSNIIKNLVRRYI